MLLDMLVEVAARVADIVCITQIACRFISVQLLCWLTKEGFTSVPLRSSMIFLLVNIGSKSWLIFFQGREVVCEPRRQISDPYKAR